MMTHAQIDASSRRLLEEERRMSQKRKTKRDPEIEPSKLMELPKRILNNNRENLEKAGLLEFIEQRWPEVDLTKVKAFFLESKKGTLDES